MPNPEITWQLGNLERVSAVPKNKSVRRLSSINGAAESANVSTKTIRRWIAEGRITGYRVGPRLIKVDLDELEASFRRVGEAAAK
jgi:excisionase family DNA binding protein